MLQPYLLIVQLLQTLFVGANQVIISSKTMVALETATVKSIQSVQLVVELSIQVIMKLLQVLPFKQFDSNPSYNVAVIKHIIFQISFFNCFLKCKIH